jgi:hypothetical protein
MIRKTLGTLLLTILLFPFTLQNARAQSEVPKLELGGYYSFLGGYYSNDSGFGGRFGINLSQFFAFEASYTAYPEDHYPVGKRGLSLFGLKFGARSDSAGFFTLISPGFTRYSSAVKESCLGYQFLPSSCFEPQIRFGLNVGGGFELFPSRNTYIRFDIGNLWIDDINGNSNNLLMNVGAGFRF